MSVAGGEGAWVQLLVERWRRGARVHVRLVWDDASYAVPFRCLLEICLAACLVPT